RDFISSAMNDNTMQREHALIPLLDPKRVLCPKTELNATVKYSRNIEWRGFHCSDFSKIDPARNREYIRVLGDRDLPKTAALLCNRIGRNQADMDLPRVEHFEHFSGSGLLNIDFQPGGAGAAHERGGQQGLDRRIDASDADNGPFPGGKFAQSRFRLVD